MSGVFFSFEGGEGSGKSVQTAALARSLTERGREVILTREPGGTAAGERIREVLLHASEASLSPEAQVLLYSAARAQLVRDVIRPALHAGKVVIADRYFDSTLAYQGYGHGVSLDAIRSVTHLAIDGLLPARTFLLDVPVDVGLGRSQWRSAAKWDRFEVLEAAFHERVREGYRRLAAAEPERFVLIHADRDEDSVSSDIRRAAEAVLSAV